jgi:uncharacterized protein YkwD
MGLRKIILGAGLLGLAGISAFAIPKDNPYTQVRAISMCLTRAECDAPLTEIPTITEGYGKAMYQGLLGNRSDSEKELLELINSKRQEVGACPLEDDPVLTKVAEIRADELVRYGSGKDTLSQYMTIDSGVGTVGENTNVYDRLPYGSIDNILDSFQNTPKARENILSTRFCRIGVADIVFDNGPNQGRYTAVIVSD